MARWLCHIFEVPATGYWWGIHAHACDNRKHEKKSMLKTRLQVQIRSTGHRGQPADTDGRQTQRTPANTQTANRKQPFRLEDNRIIGLTNSHRNKKLIRYDRGEQILLNSRRQMGVIKEVPYRVPANSRRYQTTVSSPGNLSPGICATLCYETLHRSLDLSDSLERRT